jgi:DNA-directed RNA polymerase alpha subunit
MKPQTLFRAADLVQTAAQLQVPLPASAAALLEQLPPADDLRAAILFLEQVYLVRQHGVMSRTTCEMLSLSSFAFPTRTRGVLRRAGIRSVRQLLDTSADELLRTKNFGHKSLVQLREALARHGLYLRGDGPPAEAGSRAG